MVLFLRRNMIHGCYFLKKGVGGFLMIGGDCFFANIGITIYILNMKIFRPLLVAILNLYWCLNAIFRIDVFKNAALATQTNSWQQYFMFAYRLALPVIHYFQFECRFPMSAGYPYWFLIQNPNPSSIAGLGSFAKILWLLSLYYQVTVQMLDFRFLKLSKHAHCYFF